MPVAPLPPDQLRRPCNPRALDFKTTADLDPLEGVLGQGRAVAAVRFGVGMPHPGYNIFALGPPGTGKRSVIRHFLSERAQGRPAPSDWVYVHRFDDPHRPQALRLPPGKGRGLRQDMDDLIATLKVVIPASFESEEYQTRRAAIDEEYKERQDHAFRELGDRAKTEGIALLRTPTGFAFAPLKESGDEVLPPDEFAKLGDKTQKQIEAKVSRFHDELAGIIRQVPQWKREAQEQVEALDRETTQAAVRHPFEDLLARYGAQPEVTAYLKAVEEDLLDHADLFKGDEKPVSVMGITLGRKGGDEGLSRYRVNLLVDHDDEPGAPVVEEDNPTYANLVGRIEHQAQMGALLTDFTLIKPGALHRANGGYLVLDARKILTQPFAWEGLKRALTAREIRTESLGQALSLISTVSLEPEPIPLDVKVVLLGERFIYYLLAELDPEFAELFKIEADFDERMGRDPEDETLFARLLAGLARREGLRPFHNKAVAAVIEQAARWAGDQDKLSTRFGQILDLLREADFLAGEEGGKTVKEGHVVAAIQARRERAGRIRERLLEATENGVLRIETDGVAVGQINGLAVTQLGDEPFGHPSRISARVWQGKGELIDIERQVKMGGAIHSKGVLILAGYLGGQYAQRQPLSLSASLVFEQNYGGVDGDSASSTELYVLLSALTGLALRQDLAVTGSIDQHGRVQAIGGANEKIEGFFALCQRRGLTGKQGVLIPASNVRHLMLRADVVKAVAKGRFHIYPIETVGQGIELLTGVAAGAADDEGRYPEDTVHGKAQAALARFLAQARAQSRGHKEEGGNPAPIVPPVEGDDTQGSKS